MSDYVNFAHDALVEELERLRAENSKARLYATELAESTWRGHYKTSAPNWKPLDDLLGILSQLDNMLTGWGEHHPSSRDTTERPQS